MKVSAFQRPSRLPALHRTDRRWRSIQLAAIASIASKVAATASAVIVVPLVANALGPQRLAAFFVVSSLTAWLPLASLGVGPSLSRRIADSRLGVADKSAYISAGYVAALVAVGLAAAVAVTLVALGSRSVLVGIPPEVVPEATAALIVALVAGGAIFVLGTVDFVLIGMLRQYVVNSWTAVGTVIGIAAAVAVYALAPGLTGFLVAPVAGLVVAKIAASAQLFRAHPEFVPSLRAVRVSRVIALVGPGLGFTVIQVGGYLNTQMSVVVLASLTSTADVVAAGLVLRSVLLASGIVGMVVGPLWPALMDATTAEDSRWAKRAYRRVMVAGIGYSILASVVLVAFAKPWLEGWGGNAVVLDHRLLAAFAAYFPLAVWNHIHVWVLVGLNGLRYAALAQIAESAVAISLVAILAGELGPVALPFALAAGAACTGLWYLPLKVNQIMRGIS